MCYVDAVNVLNFEHFSVLNYKLVTRSWNRKMLDRVASRPLRQQSGTEVIKHFFMLTQLSMKFIMLINVKVQSLAFQHLLA